MVQIWSRNDLELRGDGNRVVNRVDTQTMVCGPKAFTDEMIAILHKVRCFFFFSTLEPRVE